MAVHIVRFGEPRQPGEGIRVGTVRYLPRGVAKAERLERFFDVWLPELAPSEELLRSFRTTGNWRALERGYRRQLREPAARHLLELLALLSHSADFAVGCYCEDIATCHRRILAEELTTAGAKVVRGEE